MAKSKVSGCTVDGPTSSPKVWEEHEERARHREHLSAKGSSIKRIRGMEGVQAWAGWGQRHVLVRACLHQAGLGSHKTTVHDTCFTHLAEEAGLTSV